jgi:hypothetical protein
MNLCSVGDAGEQNASNPNPQRTASLGAHPIKLEPMTPFFWIWTSAIASLFPLGWLLRRRRTAAMGALALRRGFIFRDRTLPGSLTLHGTALERVTSYSNAMEGSCGGAHVIIFDCRIGSGKASWYRTVFAIETTGRVFPNTALDMTSDTALNLVSERVGSWTILYRPWKAALVAHGLTPIPQIETVLGSLGA